MGKAYIVWLVNIHALLCGLNPSGDFPASEMPGPTPPTHTPHLFHLQIFRCLIISLHTMIQLLWICMPHTRRSVKRGLEFRRRQTLQNLFLFLPVCIQSSFKREQYSYWHVKKLTASLKYILKFFSNAIYFQKIKVVILKRQSHSGGLGKQF